MGDGRITRVVQESAGDGGASVRATRVVGEVGTTAEEMFGRATRVVVEVACPYNDNGSVTRVLLETGVNIQTDGRATRAVSEVAGDDTIETRVTRYLVEAGADMAIPVHVTRVVVEAATPNEAIVGVEQARVTRAVVEVAVPYVADTDCVEWVGTRTLSFQELRRRVLRLLGEDVTTPTYWTITEIGGYVSDAYLRICRDTKALEEVEGVTTVIGTSEYVLSERAMQIKRVFLDDWSLPNVTKWERDRQWGNWEGQSGKIKGYITSQQNNRTFRFDQVPSAAGSAEVWTVRVPPALEEICDGPELPEWSHMGIAYLAAATALRKNGDMKNIPASEAYAAMAGDYIGVLKGLVANRSGERAP